MNFQFERVPRIILAIAAIGTPVAGIWVGPLGALGFAIGAIGSWWNYLQLVRVVKALAVAATGGGAPSPTGAVLGLFLRFAVLGALVLVILKYSKISLIALLIGLFASTIAIALELIYESVWSTKSG